MGKRIRYTEEFKLGAVAVELGQDAITAKQLRMDIDLLGLVDVSNKFKHSVQIEYDAQNSYGALLRNKQNCSFISESKILPMIVGDVDAYNISVEAVDRLE